MEERFLKLANTAYKVLEFFPEHDLLKNKAKEKVLAILENLPIALATDGWISFQKDKVLSQIINDIDIFLSLIKIAKSQKWIDQMNYLILLKEYDALKKELPQPKFKDLNIKKCKDKSGDGENAKAEIASNMTAVESRNDDYQLTHRQKKILEMLNTSEKAQVADILKVVPDVTKRTIRRDLDGLLEIGKIVRVGQWNQVFYQKNTDNDRTSGRTVILS